MEYAGRGDPARTMALLWRSPPGRRRGPKQRLDLDRVVDAAVSLADAERDGLATLSMRGVAQELGVGTASLYTYVPGKAELLELMVDRVVGAQPLPEPGDGPRAGLAAYARAELALCRRHPWILQVSTARTVLGPGVVARYDATLGLLAGQGMTARQVVAAVAALDAYIRGAASVVVEAEQAQVVTERSDDQWWADLAPLLGEHMAGGHYPNVTMMDDAGAFAPTRTDVPYTMARALDRFASGLTLLLDAIVA